MRPALGDFLPALGRRVDDRIASLVAGETARWVAVDSGLAEPFTSLAALVLAGGKRLRPAFCVAAYVGAGGDADDPEVVDAAAALELLHCFALVHDDVMDAAESRRGQPSVHVRHEARHREERWRGEARRFGEGVAILVGDLAFVYADVLMAGLPPGAMAVFNELRLEVNVGQYLDLLRAAQGGGDASSARTVSLYKSAKYTVERPLHIGAALAGRLDELAGVLSAYGLPLGEAFQLRDDLLGGFGDPERVGKPVGGDLRSGKATALYVAARRRAGPAATRLLEQRFGREDLSDCEVASITELFEETGAREEIESRIGDLAEQAIVAIEDAPLAPAAIETLVALAGFVAARDC